MTDEMNERENQAPRPDQQPTRSTDPLTQGSSSATPGQQQPYAAPAAPAQPTVPGQQPTAGSQPYAGSQPHAGSPFYGGSQQYGGSQPMPGQHAAPGSQHWYSPTPGQHWAQGFPPPPYPATHAAASSHPRRLGAWIAIGAAAALVVGATGFGGGYAVGEYLHHGQASSSSAAAGGSATQQPNGQFGFGESPFGDGSGNGSGNGFGSGGGFGSNGGTGSTTGAGAPSNMGAIAKKVNPAVVDIVTNFGYQQAAGAGTGIVLTSNGLILTNNHVIDGATSIKVTDIGNGQSYAATVLGYSSTKDVALLQLKNASNLTTANLGNSSTVAVGDGVVALGNAGGKGGTPSVAGGSVTALNQSITAGDALSGTSEQLSGLIQVNAPIQSGDSGGPLVNASAQVIGMTTAAATSNGHSVTSEGYAIPIGNALAVVQQIQSGQTTTTVHVGATPFLGVMIATHTQVANGAPVDSVVTGGAAANAGIRAGDIITAVGGHQVTSATRLSELLTTYHPGDKVTVHWVDSTGTPHVAAVTLQSGPPA